jgi:hypothetical protein
MQCLPLRERMPEFLAGTLPEAARAELDTHLGQCAACREELRTMKDLWTQLGSYPEIQPTPALRSRFRASLAAYRLGLDHARTSAPSIRPAWHWIESWWRGHGTPQWAGALSWLMAGLLAGLLWRGPARPAVDTEQLRAEMASLRREMNQALLQHSSVNERLKGVNAMAHAVQPDPALLNALLRVLNTDPNLEVRLAAIEAIQPFAEQAAVRKGLVLSLTSQESPLVQIELINLLVEIQERQCIELLEALAHDTRLDATVRERAAWGLQYLS